MIRFLIYGAIHMAAIYAMAWVMKVEPHEAAAFYAIGLVAALQVDGIQKEREKL